MRAANEETSASRHALTTEPANGPAPASRLHASATVRWMLWIAGSVALLLGILGVFLPVLPTTPFILLAAACYARASERFHGWLLRHETFGPTIRNWEQHRSIAPRTKRIAITMMTLSIAASIYVVREHPWLQGMLALVALTVGVWMWRLPEHGEPPLNTPSRPEDASR